MFISESQIDLDRVEKQLFDALVKRLGSGSID